jgi:glutathione S-transferase
MNENTYRLVGRYASPSVRRVAIAMVLQDIPFQLLIASPLLDPSVITPYNPVGRVPVLILPDGRRLVDSSAILDTLQELGPSGLRLIPATGPERARILQLCAIMSTATEKAIIAQYEHLKRPPEKFHQPYYDGLLAQVTAALTMIEESLPKEDDFLPEMPDLSMITVTVGWRFLRFAKAVSDDGGFAKIQALAERYEALPAFAGCKPETY